MRRIANETWVYKNYLQETRERQALLFPIPFAAPQLKTPTTQAFSLSERIHFHEAILLPCFNGMKGVLKSDLTNKSTSYQLQNPSHIEFVTYQSNF